MQEASLDGGGAKGQASVLLKILLAPDCRSEPAGVAIRQIMIFEARFQYHFSSGGSPGRSSLSGKRAGLPATVRSQPIGRPDLRTLRPHFALTSSGFRCIARIGQRAAADGNIITTKGEGGFQL